MMKHFNVWGREGIDQNTMDQMEQAMKLPVCVAGALMPDAHLGYGLPIGGVFALDNAVCPYAVGVDIACRMKLTIFDAPASLLQSDRENLIEILERETHFGVGVSNSDNPEHDMLYDKEWDQIPVLVDNKERGRAQLGTSGSGNHFVEWGAVDDRLALLSHSGSRGVGAQVCNYYSKEAKKLRPEWGDLAWFDLDSDLGDEYWQAMQLAGRYASANHYVIHSTIEMSLRADVFDSVENHHNFAWKEGHGGRLVVVHRKGATPAGYMELGIIPGSMGTPTYIVWGLGNPASMCSSSHGAGRIMSRKQAKKTFDYETEIAKLTAQGITVLSAGADEVVGVYKDIRKVMEAQKDLVNELAVFMPSIVKMAPETKKRWEK